MKLFLLAATGFVLLGLGAIGLVLPIWPTTPFLLAAAACFSCMPRLRAWLLKLPVFGEHIRNYQTRTGLARRTVVLSLIFLWGMLALSCVFMQPLALRLLLALVGAAVTAHIIYVSRPRAK